VHIAELLIPEHSSFEVEIANGKLKVYKSSNIDQIPAELLQAEVIRYVLRSTNLLIVFGMGKNCHSSGRNLLLYLYMKSVVKLTVIIIEGYHCYHLHTELYPILSQG
jgi:hypothetical protein